MPRSSKHKSRKHTSRGYSDSEKDSGLKDRKGKEESLSKASKDSISGEKRKGDSKDVKESNSHGNGEHSDGYGSSKRRKERAEVEVGERWNGDEGLKKSKTSGDSKSRRRDGSVGVYGEVEGAKKSSGKAEGKHKDSSRKESKELGPEKERKFREGRSERLVDDEEQRAPKQLVENTDPSARDELQSPDFDYLHEKQTKMRDDSREVNRCLDDDRDKDGKQKSDKYVGKYHEEVGKEYKYRHDKQRDEHSAKDYSSSLSNDKHARSEKETAQLCRKRSKTQESDRDRDHDSDGDLDNNVEGTQDHECHLECDRNLNRLYDRNHDREYDHDRDHDYSRGWDWDGDHELDRESKHDLGDERERDHHRGRDGCGDYPSSRHRGSGGKRRPLDDRDNCNDAKSRVKAHNSDMEKKALGSGQTESDSDKGRSQSRHVHGNSSMTSRRRRSSPGSHPSKDEQRDSIIEQRNRGSRETGVSRLSERGIKYKSMEKPLKVDDGPVREMSAERLSSSKASSMGLVDRSPSSTSVDRRYMSRGGIRRSLDIEEAGWRKSVDAREFSSEEKLTWELPSEKPCFDESYQVDSSFHGRTFQGNTSSVPPPAFRAGLDRPFMSSLDDNIRDNSSARYRWSKDPSFGRGHENSWRGMPNWSSPMPNGFVPFQHGPPPGGFQAAVPQFPSQPLFSVRPMDVNHSGIPYHLPDASRFPAHLRPFGWEHMMDSAGPHLHGWDTSASVYRDDPHAYSGLDWDQKRHLPNNRGWDSNSENQKEQVSDEKKDMLSPSQKEEYPQQALKDDIIDGQAVEIAHDNNVIGFDEKAAQSKSSSITSLSKQTPISLPTDNNEKTETSTKSSDDASRYSCFYLSKLDISVELAEPELYDQCMDLLKVGKSGSVNGDATVHLQLEDSSPRLKHATNLLGHSLFPAIDSSIFQRALDLYKKQRVEMQNGDIVKIDVASHQVKVEQQSPDSIFENMPEAFQTDQTKVANTPKSVEEQEDIVPVRDALQENQGEALPPSGEKKDEPMYSGEAVENCIALSNASPGETCLPVSGDGMRRREGTSSDAGKGDWVSDPLNFKNGSSNACDALMCGSNESESLILSRIHHSPESTH